METYKKKEAVNVCSINLTTALNERSSARRGLASLAQGSFCLPENPKPKPIHSALHTSQLGMGVTFPWVSGPVSYGLEKTLLCDKMSFLYAKSTGAAFVASPVIMREQINISLTYLCTFHLSAFLLLR